MTWHGLTEPPVLAALIAACSALVITVLQFFTQRRQSNSIEELKARLSQQTATQAKYLETYLNFTLEGRQAQTQAYASLLQAIQMLRDKMRQFLEQPESYHRDVLYRETLKQAEAIVKTYSANQLHFGEAERSVAHEVKNVSRTVAYDIEQLRGSDFKQTGNHDCLQAIRQAEERLANLQTHLRRLAIEANAAFVRSLDTGKDQSS
jgi:hypothetical protein